MRRTFRLELNRAVTGGVIEAFSMTFIIFFMERVYGAGDTAKAAVISSQRAGLLFGFLAVGLAQRFHMAASRMASGIFVCATLGMVVSASATTAAAFAVGVAVASFLWSCTPPLVTQFYRSNYPSERRGRIFSITSVIRSLSAVCFGVAVGKILDANALAYRPILWVGPVVFMLAALLLWRVPVDHQLRSSKRLSKRSFWAAFLWLKHDRRFALAIAAWMFVGMAMLMVGALLVEYVTNPDYGLAYDPFEIALVTIALPTGAQIVTAYLWGGWFDRFSFFRLRLVLNTLGSIAVLVLFLSSSFAGVCGGALLLGVFRGGGHIVWNLWVTKIAPEDHVGEYMSVHTFFTGIRGMATPWLGFYLLRHHGAPAFAWSCFALICVSSILVIPLIRDESKSLPDR